MKGHDGRLTNAARPAVTLLASTIVVLCSGCTIADGVVREASSDEAVLWWIKDRQGLGRPAVDASHVYFTAAPHLVVAVERSSGRVAWSRTLPVSVESLQGSGAFYGEGAVAHGGRVFVSDEDVFALDGRTGEILWRFRPAGSRNTGVFLPAIAGDWLISGSTNGFLFAVDQVTGREIWRSKVVAPDTVTMYRPQVSGELIAVGFSDFVVGGGGVARGGAAVVELSTGTLRWRRYLPLAIDSQVANGVSSPAVVADAVVIGAWDGPAYAFELSSGQLRWMTPAVGTGDQVRGLRPVASDGGLVFVGSSAGVVQALDARSGERVWSATPSFGSTNELLASWGRLYWSYSGGQFEVRDASTGRRLWTRAERPLSFSGPIDDGTLVFVSSPSSGFAALRR